MEDRKIVVMFLMNYLGVGGAEQQLLELVRGIDKTHFHPIVATLYAGGTLEPELREIPGVELISLNRRSKYDFFTLIKVFRLLRQKKVDIIQPFLTPATFFGILPALFSRTPIKIVTERCGLRTNTSLGNNAYRAIEDFLTRFANQVVPNSKAGEAYLLSRGIDASRIQVIYNGINLQRLTPDQEKIAKIKAELQLPADGKVVGIMGRLAVGKDHPTFLRADRIISEKMPQTRFAIVGDGPERARLEELANELGLASKVVFFGNQRDVGTYLSTFDVACLCSKDLEGCSNVALEAMAVARPLVITDVGGNRELIEPNQAGLLIPCQNPQALAENVLYLLQQPDMAQDMGRRAQETVYTRFSLEQMVEEYQSLYLKALRNRHNWRHRLGTFLNRLHRRSHRYIYSVRTAFSPRIGSRPMCLLGTTRESWENAFLSLWEPLLKRFSAGKALVRIDGPQISSAGTHSDGYEGFARTFMGVAFYLHQKSDSTIKLSNDTTVDIAALYREGIVNGTNPRHKEYWGKIRSTQRLVENASVALGLLLTRRHIWDKLSSNEQNNVAAWFQKDVLSDFHMNNWQWFKVFHQVFLDETGYEIDSADLARTLENIEKMYQSDGWYSDGIPDRENHYDYYVPWAMQFYPLLFCYLTGDRHNNWKQRYLDRFRKFSQDYQYFFTPNNHPPLYGRSQLYRFASIAPWGVSILLDCSSAELSWIKKAVIDTVNSFLNRDALREDGTLSMGYYGEFKPMLEPYSGPASAYWSFKGFSFLLLPKEHPFWSTNVNGVRPRKLIQAIPLTRIVLLHSGSSHVIMLNAGSSHSGYPPKYNRFAYSNIFLPNYEREYPVDNMLLLRPAGGRWYGRGPVLHSFCNGDTCQIDWSPDNAGDVKISTILIGRPDGYVAIHKLCSGLKISFYTGGFALSQDTRETQKLINSYEAIIRGKQGQVGMKILHGEAVPGIHQRVGLNPAGRHSFVPCLKGEFNGIGDSIVVAVWANTNHEEMESPVVEVINNHFHLEWSDDQHQVCFH